jgi:formylglycine-generating enzyme required for sulfatase activity
MKSQWIWTAASVTLVLSAMLVYGCAKCGDPCQGESSPCVVLPKNFVVVQGMSSCDYDEEGMPYYIMNCKDGSVMGLVPETIYVMGTNTDGPNEAPPHKVRVGEYYIDLYEVSNAQFARFAKQMGRQCKSTLARKYPPCGTTDLLSSEVCDPWIGQHWLPANDDCYRLCKGLRPCCMEIERFKEYWQPCVNDCHPARSVSFWEAWYYTRWVGKDLPTEAEWELAAKGPANRLYPWGQIEPDSQNLRCNYAGSRPEEDGFPYVAPVTAFAAGRSPYGAYNMAGNVWEWTKDFYDATYYSTPYFADTQARCVTEVEREFKNPQGPIIGCERVLRGGAYTSDIATCRTTSRIGQNPNFHGMNIGFRGVLRIR